MDLEVYRAVPLADARSAVRLHQSSAPAVVAWLAERHDLEAWLGRRAIHVHHYGGTLSRDLTGLAYGRHLWLTVDNLKNVEVLTQEEYARFSSDRAYSWFPGWSND